VTTKKKTPLPERVGGHPLVAEFSESHIAAPDGTPLYVRSRRGASELTALFCDGIACDGFIWKYLWPELGERLSLAHLHYRGHGRSGAPRDPERIGVDAHAADVDCVRRAIGDPPVVLIGHSFGTQVILEAYRARPERVRALVFVCGSFGRVTYTFKGTDMLASVLPDLVAFVSRHPHIGRALWSHVPAKVALGLARLTGDVDVSRVKEEDVEPYFQHVIHVDFAMFLHMLRAAGEHSAEDLLPHVKVPSLVIAGELDSFTPPDVSRAMAEAIPEAELGLLPGGTHLLPLEQHDSVRGVIDDFLDRRVLGREEGF
jgi:pimeloyl-ACP methyl ester carboxylesterase